MAQCIVYGLYHLSRTDCVTFCVHLQIIQYQTVRYDTLPLSPISRNRLSEYMIAFMIRLLGYIFGALV